MRSSAALLALGIASITNVSHSASVVIDTTVGWNGQESLAPFGDGGAGPISGLEVFGQTIVVPIGAPTLQDFSFWLQHSPDDGSDQDLYFSGVVMAWNTDRAVGPVLYESALRVVAPSQTTMTEYAFETGGLTLISGEEYVLFLSANNMFWDDIPTLIRVGWQNADTYAQGASWNLKTFNFPELITALPWNNPFGSADFVITATFVPIPAAVWLFGSALGMVGWLRRSVLEGRCL